MTVLKTHIFLGLKWLCINVFFILVTKSRTENAL